MRKKRLNELSPSEENDIDALINCCDYSTPFHKICWLKIIQDVIEKDIWIILDYDNNGHIKFYLPVLLDKKNIFYDLSSFSMKYELVYGGPIARDNNFTLDNNYYTHIKNALPRLTKSLLLTLPPHFPITLCEKKRLKHIYNTPIISLDENIDNIWKSLDYKKVRWGINRAQNEGVKLVIDKNEYIANFYDYLKETFARFDKSMLPLLYYKKIIKLPFVHIFAAVFKNIPIAVTIVLIHKEILYYWANSSSLEHRGLSANDFLVWEIWKWANEKGYKYFDFLITHIEDLPGRSKFKLKFGADLYPIYEYRFSNAHNVFMFKIINQLLHPKLAIQKIANKIK